MKKFTDKVEEAYQMDLDRGDISTEHAKEIISFFIENELDGVSLKDSFDKVYSENLEGSSPDSNDEQDSILKALTDYINELNRMVINIRYGNRN